ncbi:hypothetical protein M0802_012307 [Mischocyttarus mexicanus]|nr:hypothetical protein M0802_012307 [Mischocyttarus mexicanus]
MRPLSFENLRRLVSRKKDRNEPSFKRSESFKRISIRKSYLDRGKRRNKLHKNLEPVITAQPVVVVSSPVTTNNTVPPDLQDNKTQSRIKEQQKQQQKQKQQEVRRQQENVSLSRGESISYDEWLQGVGSSSREKLHDKVLVQEQINKSKINTTKQLINDRQLNTNDLTDDLNSAILSLKPFGPSPTTTTPTTTITTTTTTTIINDTNEWIYSDKNVYHQQDNNHGQTRDNTTTTTTCGPLETGPPSVSISLGRVWRDAVPVPYPSSSGPSVHHSLDSALKERKPTQPTVARTVSAPEKKIIVKDNATSSSAFGFSLRFSKLADFRAGPVWFVPPERRRSRRQRRVWREIRYFPEDQEEKKKKKKNNVNVNKDNDEEEEEEEEEALILEKFDDYYSSNNLSDDQFDDQKLLLSGDFNERRRDETFNSLVSSSLGSFSITSSSSSVCPVAPKISDFNEDKLFSEELRNRGLLGRKNIWKPSSFSTVTTENYFTSSQFINFLAKKNTSQDRNRDITQKGYEKKRTRLLQQYASKQLGKFSLRLFIKLFFFSFYLLCFSF